MASMSRGMFDHMDKHIEKFSNEKVRYLYVYAEDLNVELEKRNETIEKVKENKNFTFEKFFFI